MRRLTALCYTIAALAAPAAGGAQMRVDIVPRIGLHNAINELGPVAPATGAWFLRVERPRPTASFGGSIEVTRAASMLSARAVGFATLPAKAEGSFGCYPGLACPAVFIGSDVDVTVVAALLDAVWSPVSPDRALRPYALLGGGYRRYGFAWPATGSALVGGGRHSENTWAVHAGAGVDLRLLGGSFRLELTDLWSPEGDEITAPPLFAPAGLNVSGRRAQHDFGATVGWRLLRF